MSRKSYTLEPLQSAAELGKSATGIQRNKPNNKQPTQDLMLASSEDPKFSLYHIAGKSRENSSNNNNHSTNNNNDKRQQTKCSPEPDKCEQRIRFHVALLGLAIAAANCYAQATFCIAIVEMVLPADFVKPTEEPLLLVVGNSPQSSTKIPGAPVSSTDDSCPIEYRYKSYYEDWRFPASGSANQTIPSLATSNVIDTSNRFDWDASRQGLLLGAFAVGMAPLQVIGGRLAELYGAKWVLLGGCIGSALTNLTIPLFARFSFVLLIANRVIMGVTQAGMEPGLICLLSQWLAPAETGFFISMLLFAICIGFFLGSLCSSFLLTLGFGWPSTYYVAGLLNLAIGLLWYFYASSKPSESSLISSEELHYIERAQQVAKEAASRQRDAEAADWRKRSISPGAKASLGLAAGPMVAPPGGLLDRKQSSQTLWRNILSSRSVWAFIICKISIRWCADVMSIELPTYLANVLHLSIKLNGIVNSISSALVAVFSFITGYLVNEILASQERQEREHQRRGTIDGGRRISKTNLRKLFQSMASFGCTITLVLMTRYDCNIPFSMSMLFILSCCLVMGTGGELQIPYDMTSQYPGTLHGMACTLSVSGWLAPPLIGLILGDQPSSRERWNIVWYLTASIVFIGGLTFVLFADASPRDFNRDRNAKASKRHRPSRPNGDLHLASYVNSACDDQANNRKLLTSTSNSSANTGNNGVNNNNKQQLQQQQQQKQLIRGAHRGTI